MKLAYPALLTALVSSTGMSTPVFINEFHYDNAGSDRNEFVEIIAPQGTDLSGYQLIRYNGANGEPYGTDSLSGLVTSLGTGVGTYLLTYPSNGIQNGAPDGLALVNSAGEVIQFISYEGTLTASAGPAAGETSVDVGVSEDGSTSDSMSVQLRGDGADYTDFTWTTGMATQGDTNEQQTFDFSREPFINELHYDNTGGDVGEFIEVAAQAGTDLGGYTLELYNGSNGTRYETLVLSGVVPNEQAGMGTLAFFQPGIQNGAPDGVALINPAQEVVQFISYEGTFTASEGTAAGMLSTDIGVSESAVAVGESLQLGGEGNRYEDFSWRDAAAQTPGEKNLTQVFSNTSDEDGGDDGSDSGTGDTSLLFINEFHYDDVSTDNDEFVELAGPAGTDLSTVSLVFYNGSNNSVYRTEQLSGVISEAPDGNGFGVTVLSLPTNGIQNGGPDGIALVADGQVLEFISYEGVMTASGGPADGMTSTDIGVQENGEAEGFSLQRTGTGYKRCTFTWDGPVAQSAGSINAGQTFTDTDVSDCDQGPGDDGDNGDNNAQLGQCGENATLISAVQGNGFVTPLEGQQVVVEGIVTHVAPGLDGFYLQEEATDTDNDPATSEGVFVYAPGESVSQGAQLRVLATAGEYFSQTQLSDIAGVSECSASADTIEPTALSLPVTSEADFEALEGMLVASEQALTITETYNYQRFGELGVASERLYNPNQLYAPRSDEAQALRQSNALNSLLVDDSDTARNPTPYLPPNLSPFNTLRAGDALSNIQGVMGYGFDRYRVQLTGLPDVVNLNLRNEAPVLTDADMRIASFNVLNLFNGNGDESGFPTARGADTYSEYQRQLTKIVNAIVAIDADVIGLMEIENDGYGTQSAIAQLVNALNSEVGSDSYAYVNASALTNDQGTLGTDAIAVGIIYQVERVTPLNAPKLLDSSNSISDERGVLFDDGKNRPSLAQAFTHSSSGKTFVVDVNHLKSKGSGCGAGDDDTEFGQGNCNLTRTRAAQALDAWLGSEFDAMPAIMLGDLNAYAKEDPIQALLDAGWIDSAATVLGESAYSYTFDGQLGTLDYLLVNKAAHAWLTDVTEWHINADELSLLDYNEEDKASSLLNTLVYRASDHDPVIASFSLPAAQVRGDWDSDGDVDINDIRGLMTAIAARQAIDMAFDLNSDGVVNMLDIYTLYSLCTRQMCVAE
ncbi:ExeM/NucH family extracellular endonuclease [Alteromonas halophila]|uniref:LTD domain-containing protein n=1 Tax=Alteromonas halophila TaxID=516698 RepID=A0A918MXB7_9ALTE|nr:ExeM/NucH family extracellular endonuclease [Alteromonas halophila]GGW80347.1 hypothetical protein GCM10007391_11570 [Alteromonas halophila]